MEVGRTWLELSLASGDGQSLAQARVRLAWQGAAKRVVLARERGGLGEVEVR